MWQIKLNGLQQWDCRDDLVSETVASYHGDSPYTLLPLEARVACVDDFGNAKHPQRLLLVIDEPSFYCLEVRHL